MTDAERVLKGISHCLQTQPECEGCPYNDICYHDSICKTMVLHASFVINDLLTKIDRDSQTLRIMFNRCISFGGALECSSCKQRKRCENERSFYHGYYLTRGHRVRKDGEQE